MCIYIYINTYTSGVSYAHPPFLPQILSSGAPQCRWPLCQRSPGPGSRHLPLPRPEPGSKPGEACVTDKKLCFVWGKIRHLGFLWPKFYQILYRGK